MAVFVVLALAILVICVGVAVMAGVLLRRQVKGLRTAVDDASRRLGALAEELQEETAVATLEVEGLQRRMEQLKESRSD